MIQRSFSSGEVDPALYGRADVDRWKAALKTCSNWLVQPEGGIIVRQGFELKASVAVAATTHKLIPFEFGPADSYVLLMYNDTTMRVIRNGALVENDGGGAYSLAVTLNLDTVRWVQSGDTMYFADGVNVPKRLVREALGWEGSDVTRHDNWTFGSAPMTPTVTSGVTMTITPVAGSDQIRYRLTYTDKDGLESAVCRSSYQLGTASLSGSRWNINKTTHGLETNDSIEILSAKLSDAGVRVYEAFDIVRVVKVDADNFTITGNNAAVSGNFEYRKIGDSEIGAQPTSSSPRVFSWSAITGADFYNIYREFGRGYGYIGSTSALTFSDPGIIPDTKDTPMIGLDPTRAVDGNGANVPVAVGLFQQRLMFGGFSSDIERIIGSHVGNYSAFDPGAEDASGLDFSLAGRYVSGIQHMVEVAGRAVVLSDTSEWVLRGGTGGGLTPTAINARADSYYGSSEVQPALIGTSLIYVQRGDKIVRDARYDFAQEALTSTDLTLWAKHLFIPGIKRLAYQRTAQILWALREDGVLLGLTYIPEQNIWGWHQHSIDGREIADICVVSEDNVDRLYCSVMTASHIYVCRLPEPWETGLVDDHLGFDMGLFYDGTVSGTGTLTGGTEWKTTETLTLTASSSVFVVGDVGKHFLLENATDDVYVTVTAYTSGTVVSVTPNTLVPTSLRGVASTAILRCAETFSGLDHLEGETVGIIADGSREADLTVASGAVTTTRKFARVQIGIPVTADAQTLDLEPDQDTYLGDKKQVVKVFLRVRATRGIEVGQDEDHLRPYKPEYEDLVNGEPTLRDDEVEIFLNTTHDQTGSLLIRQDTGLPANVLNARPIFNTGELK